MDNITDYLRSLNPSGDESKSLKYDTEYLLYREGVYIGIATWVKDINVGDSFQKDFISKEGQLISGVYVADEWKELVVKEINDISEIFSNSSKQFLCGVRSHMKGFTTPERPQDDDFIQGYYFSQTNDLDKRFKIK